MSVPSPDLPDRPATKHRTLMYLMIIVALGLVVSYNYLLSLKDDVKQGRLPMKSRVEEDLPLWLDQNGQERHLEQLKGKVIVVSYIYTTCPQGCAGIAEEMQKLQQEFGNDPNFHLLSVSLYPEHDRPEVLKAWLDQKGFGGDNWWFLTTPNGDEASGNAVRNFMFKNFRILAQKKSPEEIAKNPADVWEHQLAISLLDHMGRVRTPSDRDTLWWPFHEAFDYGWYPRPIREDVVKLLEEARSGKE